MNVCILLMHPIRLKRSIDVILSYVLTRSALAICAKPIASVPDKGDKIQSKSTPLLRYVHSTTRPLKNLRRSNVAGNSEVVLPVQRLLGEGLEVLVRVGNEGDSGLEILQDDALHVLEIGSELQAGDKEGAILLQVGVSISLSKVDVGSVKRDTSVSICSSDVVGKLDLNSASGASGGSRRGNKGKEGDSEGDSGLHFDDDLSY